MTFRRFVPSGILVAVLASGVIVGGSSGAAAAIGPSTGPTVSSWITTPDRTKLLSPGAAGVFGHAQLVPNMPVIGVGTGGSYQTMDGFGASITDSSARLLSALPRPQRDSVMASVFSPTAGIGMSFLRQPIGSSDFVDGPHYTFDDLPTGQTDFSMDRFSIAHDEALILPLIRQAIALNPALKVMATPWGQPAWMKTNGSTIGGRLKDDPAIYRAYALYLVKFVQAYESAGVPIYALSVQNEPQNRTPGDYPGTDMPVAAQVAVINALGPLLRDAGLGRVKIIAYDHNWAEHPDDLAYAAEMGIPAEPNYPADVLRSSAARWIAGTGFHCYAGDVRAQSALHDALPDKDIWFTECSGWHSVNDPPAQFFADTLKWHAANITVGTTRNWAKSVLDWNLALDSHGGPVNGGCGSNPAGVCTGVLAIDGTTVTRNAEYYTLGHLSKFVQPGAVRIGADLSNSTGGAVPGDLRSVAFQNPDRSIALVVTNAGGADQLFAVSYGSLTTGYVLPAGALVTLTWKNPEPQADGTPPTAPGTPAAAATTATSTTLTWPASTDAVGVIGYTVYANGTAVGTSSKAAFEVTGLTAATRYGFTVTARDSAGNTSPMSAPLTLTTRGIPAPGVDPAGWYQVINVTSGKCLNAANGGTTNGTALLQASCLAPAAVKQLWQFRPTSDGYYRVVAGPAHQLSWDIAGGPGATANGNPVRLWEIGGGTNQQWKFLYSGGGTYTLEARSSGQCLDVTDVSLLAGARLQVWSCTGGVAQVFRLARKG